MAKITISQGLSWLDTLEKRQRELIGLRDANARKVTQGYGDTKTTLQEPQYDAKTLDKRITLLAREVRLCKEAIKKANAKTNLDYEQDDAVLGELE